MKATAMVMTAPRSMELQSYELPELRADLVPPSQGDILFGRMAAADPDVLGVVFDWMSFDA